MQLTTLKQQFISVLGEYVQTVVHKHLHVWEKRHHINITFGIVTEISSKLPTVASLKSLKCHLFLE